MARQGLVFLGAKAHEPGKERLGEKGHGAAWQGLVFWGRKLITPARTGWAWQRKARQGKVWFIF